MKEFLLPTLVGFCSGTLASMGLGGGFVLLLYLSLFTQTEQLAAQGLNLLFFLPVMAAAAVLHLKSGMAKGRTALRMGLCGALFTLPGWALAQAMPAPALRRLFAVFLIACGLRDLLFPGQGQQVSHSRHNCS